MQQAKTTVEEYLRLEQDAAEKHEFRNGEVISMSGGSARHSLIISNVIREAGNALKGKPCRVYESNLRVRIPRSVLYTYPDAMIVCGPPQFDPKDVNETTIINPKVLIEVMSPGSESYDRGEKFDRYRTLDSMEEYLLIYQSQPAMQSFLRKPDGTWSFANFEGLQTVARVRSVEIDLPLAEVFDGVEFAAV